MNDPNLPKPWVSSSDDEGETRGVLSGNPEGLRRLRELIDAALETGEVEVGPGVRFDFRAIRVEAAPPEKKLAGSALKQAIFKFGCLAIIVVNVVLAVAGAILLWEIFTK